jgi:hypothetical protein
MEYRLDLNPAIIKDGQKYKVIHITDLSFHTAKKTPTPSVGKKIQKASLEEKSGRFYGPIDLAAVADPKTYVIEKLRQDPAFLKMVQEEEVKGYKVLLSLPNEGIPQVLGKDTVEFLESKNGKRVLRGIAKNKSKY